MVVNVSTAILVAITFYIRMPLAEVNSPHLNGLPQPRRLSPRAAKLTEVGLPAPGSLTEEHAMFRRATVTVAVLALFAPLAAGQRPDADINAKIRQEESAHSQIMRMLHVLTDVYGPRVTGSPNLKAAGDWAIREMQSWGFTNGRLEPWDFGHP